MGRLISTGLQSNGHGFEFEYKDQDGHKKCLMVCICGWNTNIDSFQHSWSVIEVKVKVKDHLSSFNINTFHPAAIFDLSDRP
jgi:hypothetical protein